ncbi:uncharacterized protein CG7065-like [Chironomus tepperi]|uniref:uncharacterized protein CG7065-like n=1 Tax=Chironomus tepperi TaxID=113505 RepID=UPI00391F7600
MESIVTSCDSLLTKTISKSNKPLIGLEYIIEFDDGNNVLRPFCCVICDIYCNENEILFHLTTHEHRIKYLELKFPSTMKILDASKKFNTVSTFREQCLSKISERLHIYLVIPKVKKYSFKVFESCKESIVNAIKSSNSKINEKSFGSPSVLLEGLNFDDDNLPTQNCCFFEIPNSSLKARLIKFYESSNISEAKIHEIYKNLRKNPEKHPMYVEEWRKYYACRYPDLIKAKIAVDGYDFQPEWISYFVLRLEELHYEEINQKNAQILHQLNLTQEVIRRDQEEVIDKIIGKSKSKNKLLNDPDSDTYIESCIRDPKIPRKPRKPHCFIDEFHSMTDEQILDPKRYEFDAPGSVFSICRQILAFKDQIRVFENSLRKIYVKAAEMEKKSFFLSEELLMDDEILILFTTVKEILRHAIDKNIIVNSQIRCAQRTVQQLNAMVFEVEYRKKRFLEIQKQENEKKLNKWRSWSPKRKYDDDKKIGNDEKRNRIFNEIFDSVSSTAIEN